MPLIALAQETVEPVAGDSGVVLLVGFLMVGILAAIGARTYRKRRG